jgi:hypothetical protein
MLLCILFTSNIVKAASKAAGIDGSGVVIDTGAGKGVDTENFKDPVIAVTLSNKGLMGSIWQEGSRFSNIYR